MSTDRGITGPVITVTVEVVTTAAAPPSGRSGRRSVAGPSVVGVAGAAVGGGRGAVMCARRFWPS